MKKIRKILFTLLAATVAAGTVLPLAGCSNNDTNGGGTSENKTIAVIAKGESHAFWQSVKSGAEDAAKKYGYTITFRGPASESARDLPSQQEMVQTALSKQALPEWCSEQSEKALQRCLPKRMTKKFLLFSLTQEFGQRI